MPAPKPGLTAVHSAPTIVCINEATVDLGVDFDRLVAALQKFLDKHFVPVWGTPAQLVKGKKPRRDTWTLLFLDHQDTPKAKRNGWVGLHHLDGNPFAKVFVQSVLDSNEKVSVAASHELAEMLVDPAINLWCPGPKRLVYAYEVCDAVEEYEFLIDKIAMCNFVYPAYFDLSRKPKSAQFDHMNKLHRPFQISPKGYATVLKNGKKIDIPGSRREEGAFQKRETRRSSQRASRRADEQNTLIRRAFRARPIEQATSAWAGPRSVRSGRSRARRPENPRSILSGRCRNAAKCHRASALF